MSQLQLTRSSSDKMIGGVCGGLAAYLGIDSTLVRIAFALLGLASGIGVPLYLVLLLIIPQEENAGEPMSKVIQDNLDDLGEVFNSTMERARDNSSGRNIFAFLLIGLGVYFLLTQFGFLTKGLFWPILLIILGGALVSRWLQNR